MSRRRGIDVSKWQGRIDWHRLSQDDIHFAIIRIGYGSADGTSTKDAYFHENVHKALESSIHIGIYFYTYARTVQAARREAEWVIHELKPYLGRISYPIAFDIEDPSLEALGKQKNTDITKEFCHTIEKAGYYAMYYTYLSFLENYLEYERLREYDLWLADYTHARPKNYHYGIWQYSDDGKIDGTHGHTDMDESFYDYPEIIKKAGLNGYNIR